MNWTDSLLIAFSLYTVIPVPHREWDSSGMEYVLAFLPAAGAAAAILCWATCELSTIIGMGGMVRAALAAVTPVFYTGGIHLDGFMDTVDALSSRRSKEEKLEILKDPNVGAFAVAGCVIYLMLYMAFSYEAGMKALLLMIPGAALSRALCGLAALTTSSARKGGMLDFIVSASEPLQKKLLAVTGGFAAVTLVLLGGLAGTAASLSAILFYFAFKRMAVCNFGGMTGDLAGFFIQSSELLMLFCMAALFK